MKDLIYLDKLIYSGFVRIREIRENQGKMKIGFPAGKISEYNHFGLKSGKNQGILFCRFILYDNDDDD